MSDEMPDDPTVQADETAEAAQSAVEPTETPVPWGDDFNPERAWNTITHLRDVEKSLEPLAKTYQRLESGEDFDTFKNLAEKYGFAIEEPEEEEFNTEEDPTADLRKQLSELAEWKQQQEAERALNEFNTHVDRLAKTAELELTDRERQWILNDSLRNGFKPDTTEAAFKDYAAWKKDQETQIISRYTGSKKAPHVSSSGTSAQPTVDLSDHNERVQHMLERMGGGPAT